MNRTEWLAGRRRRRRLKKSPNVPRLYLHLLVLSSLPLQSLLRLIVNRRLLRHGFSQWCSDILFADRNARFLAEAIVNGSCEHKQLISIGRHARGSGVQDMDAQ
ncbi:hypothetical protein SDJN03_20244, partial [Cucurbita argyrosperma subsp. sororia]